MLNIPHALKNSSGINIKVKNLIGKKNKLKKKKTNNHCIFLKYIKIK